MTVAVPIRTNECFPFNFDGLTRNAINFGCLAYILINLIEMTAPVSFPAGAIQPIRRASTVKPCDHNLKQAILLAERMIRLADKGDGDREDTGCGILYGMLRDSGYKIKRLAEDEKFKHIAKGGWDEIR